MTTMPSESSESGSDVSLRLDEDSFEDGIVSAPFLTLTFSSITWHSNWGLLLPRIHTSYIYQSLCGRAEDRHASACAEAEGAETVEIGLIWPVFRKFV